MKKTKKSKLILLTILSVFGNLPTMAKETNKNKSVNSNIKKMVGLVSNMPKWSKYTLGFGVPGLAAVLIGGSIYVAKKKKSKSKPIQIKEQEKEQEQSDSTVKQNENYKFIDVNDIIKNSNFRLLPVPSKYIYNVIGNFRYIFPSIGYNFLSFPKNLIDNEIQQCKQKNWVLYNSKGSSFLWTNEQCSHYIIQDSNLDFLIYIYRQENVHTSHVACIFLPNRI